MSHFFICRFAHMLKYGAYKESFYKYLGGGKLPIYDNFFTRQNITGF